jgi:hypothetical protein
MRKDWRSIGKAAQWSRSRGIREASLQCCAVIPRHPISSVSAAQSLALRVMRPRLPRRYSVQLCMSFIDQLTQMPKPYDLFFPEQRAVLPSELIVSKEADGESNSRFQFHGFPQEVPFWDDCAELKTTRSFLRKGTTRMQFSIYRAVR